MSAPTPGPDPFGKGCGATFTELVGFPKTEYISAPQGAAEVTFVCSGHHMGQHYDQRNGKRWPIEHGRFGAWLDPEDIPVADATSREDFGDAETFGWNACRDYAIQMAAEDTDTGPAS